MKFYTLYITLFLGLFITIYSHNLKSGNENEEQKASEYKTYLIKTQLTQKELETLIQQGEAQLVNLKKNKTQKHKEYNNTVIVKEVTNLTNLTNQTDEILQKKIEQEIKEDALTPLHEFKVDQNEVKTLVAKPKTTFIDSLYEKRFGKIYAYLTIILFIIVMISYKDVIFNQKINNSKKSYLNSYNYDGEKEYMLVKNN